MMITTLLVAGIAMHGFSQAAIVKGKEKEKREKHEKRKYKEDRKHEKHKDKHKTRDI